MALLLLFPLAMISRRLVARGNLLDQFLPTRAGLQLGAWLAVLLVVILWSASAQLEPAVVQLAAFCAAFWVAMADAMRRGAKRQDLPPAVMALLVGAVTCHAGWLLVHPDVASLRQILSPTGFSSLFLPAGVALGLVCAGRPIRRRLTEPLLAALPFGLAVARVGCFAAGCCPGRVLGGVTLPFPLIDAAVLSLGGLALDRVPSSAQGPWALGLFGATRLVLQPLRAPAGDLWLAVSLSSLWIASAAIWGVWQNRSTA